MPRPHHHVYVIELSKEVLWESRFRRCNPDYVEGRPCVYVGMTGLDPDLRFDRHKAGVQASAAPVASGKSPRAIKISFISCPCTECLDAIRCAGRIKGREYELALRAEQHVFRTEDVEVSLGAGDHAVRGMRVQNAGVPPFMPTKTGVASM